MLNTLDVGGEQARQFAEEIAMLKDALKSIPSVKDDCPKCGASGGSCTQTKHRGYGPRAQIYRPTGRSRGYGPRFYQGTKSYW